MSLTTSSPERVMACMRYSLQTVQHVYTNSTCYDSTPASVWYVRSVHNRSNTAVHMLYEVLRSELNLHYTGSQHAVVCACGN
jgi:hypothetical protein